MAKHDEMNEVRSMASQLGLGDLGYGYDRAYRECDVLWGYHPAGAVVHASKLLCKRARCLDLGCGEGKNAFYLSSIGHDVIAVDGSVIALSKAKTIFGQAKNISWVNAEAHSFIRRETSKFDLVVCAGMMHCLESRAAFLMLLHGMCGRLRKSGVLVLSLFNARVQELNGHEPNFQPLLLPHLFILKSVSECGIRILHASDRILHDYHEHVGVPHRHSITRVIGRRCTNKASRRD